MDLTPELTAYVNATQGFRPPEMTELYRLQRGQQVADLDPEELDSIEVGVKGAWPRVEMALAAFDMDKTGVILREANGYNVANGRTTHRGVEYDLRWRPWASLELAAAGTYALHRYDFSRRVDGGETIERGNDIDTAPRELYRFGLGWRPTQAIDVEAEWLVVGDYWLDAANEHRYAGHELLNLRAAWQAASNWSLSMRVTNALDVRYADRADYSFGTYRYFPGPAPGGFRRSGLDDVTDCALVRVSAACSRGSAMGDCRFSASDCTAGRCRSCGPAPPTPRRLTEPVQAAGQRGDFADDQQCRGTHAATGGEVVEFVQPRESDALVRSATRSRRSRPAFGRCVRAQ